jgi:N-acetylglucosaminyl-diphospho-decaprenol L-rhamnosyltransferase
MMPMPEPQLALIVVTHNSERWLEGFFESWKRTVAGTWTIIDRSMRHEIIVADSGSSDDTREVARRLAPDAKIISCGNIGFGAAANRGVRESTASLALVCNPDITFSALFLKQLVPLIAPFSAFAPQLLNPDGSVQPSVGDFPTIRGILFDQIRPRECRKYITPQPTSRQEVDWATGACLLFTRKAFESVGGFDEKCFLYAEEVDMQRRLKDAGHQIWFNPNAQVTHHAPAALHPNPQIKRYAARGLLRYFAKHGTPSQLLAYRLLALVSLRLPPHEALALRKKILETPTGP